MPKSRIPPGSGPVAEPGGDQLSSLLGSTTLARRPAEPLLASRTWEAWGVLLAGLMFEAALSSRDACGTTGTLRRPAKALRAGLDPLQAEGSSKRLQQMLAELALSMEPQAALHVESTVLSEDTCKMLLLLADGLSIECVLIRMGKRSSLCVSSQVGCKQACVFCATGKLGEVRNLTTHEILAQVWLAQRQARALDWPKVQNLVFMGMGEPVNNLDSVTQALQLLTDTKSFCISRWYITVSTVAPSPQQILSLAQLPCKLAWSVHAALDPVRRQLVPSSKHSLADLRDAFLKCLQLRPRRFRQLICELVLLDDVNTNKSYATALVELLSAFDRNQLLVNLIPYNDIQGLSEQGIKTHSITSKLRAPSIETVRRFQRSLWKHGVYCSVRQTRGESKASACGQLAAVAGLATLAGAKKKFCLAACNCDRQQSDRSVCFVVWRRDRGADASLLQWPSTPGCWINAADVLPRRRGAKTTRIQAPRCQILSVPPSCQTYRTPGKRVDEFFKPDSYKDTSRSKIAINQSVELRNPTIGTFMNSPYYGEDGVRCSRPLARYAAWPHRILFSSRFGSSGTIKENPAGGFSFELPGGGGIHIDNGSGSWALSILRFDAVMLFTGAASVPSAQAISDALPQESNLGRVIL